MQEIEVKNNVKQLAFKELQLGEFFLHRDILCLVITPNAYFDFEKKHSYNPVDMSMKMYTKLNKIEITVR